MTDQRVNAAAKEVEMLGALKDKEPQKEPRSQWKDVWDQFRKHKGALIGGGFLLAIALFVLIGPWVWQVDPKKLDIRNKDLRPIYTALWDSDARVLWSRPLGTDNLGRDIMATLIAGGRASLAVGWAAMVLSLLLGTLVGVTCWLFQKAGRRADAPDRSFPVLADPAAFAGGRDFVQTALTSSFGPEGGMFILIVGVIGITSWMPTARIVRGEILALKEREFVLAARSIGTKPFQIIRRHLLPNVISPIMVSATLGLATAIITESALSFLGVGFPQTSQRGASFYLMRCHGWKSFPNAWSCRD